MPPAPYRLVPSAVLYAVAARLPFCIPCRRSAFRLLHLPSYRAQYAHTACLMRMVYFIPLPPANTCTQRCCCLLPAAYFARATARIAVPACAICVRWVGWLLSRLPYYAYHLLPPPCLPFFAILCSPRSTVHMRARSARTSCTAAARGDAVITLLRLDYNIRARFSSCRWRIARRAQRAPFRILCLPYGRRLWHGGFWRRMFRWL